MIFWKKEREREERLPHYTPMPFETGYWSLLSVQPHHAYPHPKRDRKREREREKERQTEELTPAEGRLSSARHEL